MAWSARTNNIVSPDQGLNWLCGCLSIRSPKFNFVFRYSLSVPLLYASLFWFICKLLPLDVCLHGLKLNAVYTRTSVYQFNNRNKEKTWHLCGFIHAILNGNCVECVCANSLSIWTSLAEQLNHHTLTHNKCAEFGEMLLMGWCSFSAAAANGLHSSTDITLLSLTIHT